MRVFLILFSFILYGCLADTSSADLSFQAQTQTNLLQLFRSLKPWTSSGGYASADWSKAIATAQIVQRTDPRLVREALETFGKRTNLPPFNGEYEEESKVFLLMRVAFDLPQTNEPSVFSRWLSKKGNFDDRSVSWPVAWSNNQPHLVAAYLGSEGPYVPSAEFDYFLQHFPMRRLERR